MENAGEQPRVRVEGSALRCPFCHADCTPEESVVCRDCLARHHGPCWDEGGCCSTCGSIHKLVSAPVVEDAPRFLPTISSEAPRWLPVNALLPGEGSRALVFQSRVLFGAALLALFVPVVAAVVVGFTLVPITILSFFSRNRHALFTILLNVGAIVIGVIFGPRAIEAGNGTAFLMIYSLFLALVSGRWGRSSR
jgi:hypothetical protein